MSNERVTEIYRIALETVRQVASGEMQVAMDDTAGMEWLDNYVTTTQAAIRKELSAEIGDALPVKSPANTTAPTR